MNNRTQSIQTDTPRTPSILRSAATRTAGMVKVLTVGILFLWAPVDSFAMSTSPSALSFSGTAGGANPSTQSFTITNTGTGTLTWTARANAGWISSISPLNGTNTSTVTVGVSLAGLAAGTYNARITIGASGEPTRSIPISLTVNPVATTSAPEIGLSTAGLAFAGTAGGSSPAAQSFTISNSGSGTLAWTASDSAAWLILTPASGTNTGTVTAGVNLSGLAAGTYSTSITVGASGATTRSIPVSLTINPVASTPTPVIGLSTTSLAFTGTAGGANPANQSFTVSNTGSGTLTWTASDSAAWLTLTPASGTNTGTVTASVNLSGLAAGTYSGTITTSATGATGRTLPVSLTVTPATTSTTPAIGLSTTSLAFTGIAGGANPAAQSFTISNTGSGTLAWRARANAAWISSISPLNGTNTSTVSVGVSLAGLAAGTYNATVTVGASDTTTRSIPVSLTVNATSASGAASPAIGLSTTSLTFGGTAGGANPAAQSFTVSNTGSGTLTWTASDNAAWLTLTPATGTNTGTVTASVNLAGLTAGTYNGTITAAATGATGRTLPVSLTVNPASTATPIIGLSLASLTYAGTAGGTNPAAQSFTVSNTGSGTLTWTAGDSASWLTLSPAAGTNTGTVTASVNLTGLAAGTYSGTLTVSAAGATSRTLPVSLTVGSGTATTNAATLTWVANTETDLAGYKIYVGTQSGVYGDPIVLGRVNTYQVANLVVGTTYFFCITAYDSAGNESARSVELTKSIF